MRRDSPVLAVVVFLGEVLLVVGEEGVQLDALLEVLDCFHASDLLQEIEVAVNINACSDESVPVNALNLDVSVVLLELEVNCLVEVYVGSLDCVHVCPCHFKLVEIKVLWEDLHLISIIINLLISSLLH